MEKRLMIIPVKHFANARISKDNNRLIYLNDNDKPINLGKEELVLAINGSTIFVAERTVLVVKSGEIGKLKDENEKLKCIEDDLSILIDAGVKSREQAMILGLESDTYKKLNVQKLEEISKLKEENRRLKSRNLFQRIFNR